MSEAARARRMKDATILAAVMKPMMWAVATLMISGCAAAPQKAPPPPAPASEQIRDFHPSSTVAPAVPGEDYCGTLFARPWC